MPRSKIHSIGLIAWGCFCLPVWGAPVTAAPSPVTPQPIQVELCSPSPDAGNHWPWLVEERYPEPAFAFFRLPRKYVPPGIRGDRENPTLVRAQGHVFLPSGSHQVLLRSRRAARLWHNGVVILENPFPKPIADGHDPVERPHLDLGPGVRFPAPGDQESLATIEVEAGSHHFRLEFFVGGYKGKDPIRPELGETLVAASLDQQSGFHLLSPIRTIPLNDPDWIAYRRERNAEYDRWDTQRRQTAAATMDDYWQRRHAFARTTYSPDLKGLPNPSIDQLIQRRIETRAQVFKQSTATKLDPRHAELAATALRILESKCLECHGPKAKGGLRMDSRTRLLEGGDSAEATASPSAIDQSELLRRIQSEDPDKRMPPKGDALDPKEIQVLRDWIRVDTPWPVLPPNGAVELPPRTTDLEFLRRVYLDTHGLLPPGDVIEAFTKDPNPKKRTELIDRLLDAPQWADHWVGYWQDVLAENPTIVNPTLNNTGPFRWYLYESFLDNKPIDRFVTELIGLGGSLHGGGPAGFGMASQNDIPMAAKANIITTAFLGSEMKCARCHDAPYHEATQKDLLSIAALLAQEPITVPSTSTVPEDPSHPPRSPRRIQSTLKSGDVIPPAWPLAVGADLPTLQKWVLDPDNPRERLAYHITGPHNRRFAQVMVNRLWRRIMGQGLVEPPDDWEATEPTHPELLGFLADELVNHAYDFKHVARLIFYSDAYQRRVSHDEGALNDFVSPRRKRLSAEMIVDGLFHAVGKPMMTEEVNIDVTGGRPWRLALNLGVPTRAWMFGGLANNRDRPSLILPRVQAVVDLLSAFGWRASRQEPTTDRAEVLSPLQPALLNNGIVSTWLTRLTDDHELTALCLEDLPIEALIHRVYLRILTRLPSASELDTARELLREGFESRRLKKSIEPHHPTPKKAPLFVTWANHIRPEATVVQLQRAEEARRGDSPTSSLRPDWRHRMEDLVWALINLPEIVYFP